MLMICTKDPFRKFCPRLKNRVSKNGHSCSGMERNHRYSGLCKLCKNSTYCLSPARACLSFPHKGRVPHISLVFREMWDTTALSLWLSIRPMQRAVNIGGIPYLAKNERDMGHPSFVREREAEPCGAEIVNADTKALVAGPGIIAGCGIVAIRASA